MLFAPWPCAWLLIHYHIKASAVAGTTAKFDYTHFVIVKWKAEYKASLLAISMTS